MIRPIRALLDANVLVDAQVRDLFLRLAAAGLVSIRWSDDILDEMRRALERDLRIPAETVAGLQTAMRTAFPDCVVHGGQELVESLRLPDPDDRHVLAAALVSECDIIVTQNLRDFPAHVLEQHDLVALSVDEGLDLLFATHGPLAVPVVHELLAALSRPALNMRMFLDRLARVAPMATLRLGALVGDAKYERLASDASDVDAEAGPHKAVRHLLEWAIYDRDDPPPVSAQCVETLTGRREVSHEQLRDTIRTQLADFCASPGGWGFGSARRPVAPGVEAVLLLRAGSRFRIAHEPQEHVGHRFELEHSGDRWIVSGIDRS